MQAHLGNRAKLELLDSPRLRTGKGERERSFVNAVRNSLPDLIKINRYEKRAASRRDRAIHEFASMRTANSK